MKVEKRGDKWAVVFPKLPNAPYGYDAGIFDTNAEAWKWVDRFTNQGGEEGDHAGRQDWSIKRHGRSS
jgi:hypothetical protein